MHTLLPHQQQALAYALARRSIALFMEMRLGKSVVAIRWATHHQLRRVLLIAPLSTLKGSLNWEGELAREQQVVHPLYDTSSDARYARAQHTWQSRDGRLYRARARGWFLLHYEGLRVSPEVLDLPWDAIVLDESTRLRNPRAKITKLLLKNTQHIPYRAVLSGLPNPEGPLDFFTQLQVAFGHFDGYRDYWAYRHRHFHQIAYDWAPHAGVLDRIQRHVHAQAFFLSRRQAQVGSTKVFRPTYVPLTTQQEDDMAQAVDEFAVHGKETNWAAVVHGWLQRMAGGFSVSDPPRLLSDGKMRALETLVTQTFPSQPLVVWFRYNHEIDTAYTWLLARHPALTIERIHGEMPNQDRAAVQERFHADTTRLLLMQIAIGRFGWNLANADVAIYYSNSYAYEDRNQSEDRIVHLRKRTPVHLIDLVTEDSVDEDVMEALRLKKMTAVRFNRLINERLKARVEALRKGRA